MMGSSYEDELVQQTMADYLKQELGWRSVYPCNQGDFGPNGLLVNFTGKMVTETPN